MPMRRHTPTPVECSWGMRSGVTYLRFRGPTWSPAARPVVSLHGWGGTDPAEIVLQGFLRWRAGGAFPYDALLSTGRTVYIPFTGSSFGLGAGTWGPGDTAVDAMIAQAAADGLTSSTIDVVGGSMGGCNSLNWCHRHPSAWHRLLVYVPAIDLPSVWDLGGGLRSSIEAAYGVTGRAAIVTATADRDPVRLDWSGLANRITAYAASNDPLITYSTVTAWCSTWSIPLTTTTSGHLTLDDSAVDELDLLRALA